MAIHHYFPLDGDYEIRIRLRRMIYDYIVGMGRSHTIEVRLDGALVGSFTVGDADQYGYPSAYSFFGTIRGDPAWRSTSPTRRMPTWSSAFRRRPARAWSASRSSTPARSRPACWNAACPDSP